MTFWLEGCKSRTVEGTVDFIEITHYQTVDLSIKLRDAKQ
ncbi:21706_t:CDS:2 [Entrophospora sp. SA101]|nr:21706_t:CDS:2 [Entrophospora sp. SA101]